MMKLKYWLLCIVCTICCVQHSDAQTITVFTTDGDSKTIANVDSIQLYDSNQLNLTMLKADHSSVKFVVSVPQNEHWVYALIACENYDPYQTADILHKGVHQVGTQIIEIRDGDAAPKSAEWWGGKYSIKPGTAYCVLVAKAQKNYHWDDGHGAIAWGPIASYGDSGNSYPYSPEDELNFIPDYTDDVRLGNYLTESLGDETFDGFFYQQYFWTAAPTVAAESPVVTVNYKNHTKIHYSISLPSNVYDCKSLLLTDWEYAELLNNVGEYGLDAYVLAHGQSVTPNAEICATFLSVGTRYHILVTASFDELGRVQSSAHQEVNTLSTNETDVDGSLPIVVLKTTNAYSSEFVVDGFRNEDISDPFNVPAFTRVEITSIGRTMDFTTSFPTLEPGTYKVSAIVVPTAYHTLLKESLVDNKGEPYVEQISFDVAILDDNAKSLASSVDVEAPSDRVEKVVLFEKFDLPYSYEGLPAGINSFPRLKFTLQGPQQIDRRTGAFKCLALNICKIVIEPYREDSTNE